MSPSPRFHLALWIDDIAEAEAFYVGVLECKVGRRGDTWIDFDFEGHQLSLHLLPDAVPGRAAALLAQSNPVDGKDVPLPHFGLILDMDRWKAVAARLEARDVDFVIAPYLRFAGQIGEQGTMFLRDPSGNALEIKGFERPEGAFEA